MGQSAERATHSTLVLSLSKDGRAHQPWFDKLTTGSEQD
jgi:hypothetical protein